MHLEYFFDTYGISEASTKKYFLYLPDFGLLTYLIIHKLKGKSRLSYASTAHHNDLVQGKGALTLTLIGCHI